MKQMNNKPRTCATHNPGSPDCGPNCPDALRDPNATPGLVFAMADGTKVGAPADVARANQFTPASLAAQPEVGPESVEDMDDAVDDIEQRDDDSDEVDTDVEGDDDGDAVVHERDGGFDIVSPGADPAGALGLRDELRDENANLRLRIVELERANRELVRRLAVKQGR